MARTCSPPDRPPTWSSCAGTLGILFGVASSRPPSLAATDKPAGPEGREDRRLAASQRTAERPTPPAVHGDDAATSGRVRSRSVAVGASTNDSPGSSTRSSIGPAAPSRRVETTRDDDVRRRRAQPLARPADAARTTCGRRMARVATRRSASASSTRTGADTTLPGAPKFRKYQQSGCGKRGSPSTRPTASRWAGATSIHANFAYQWIDITGLPAGTYTIRSVGRPVRQVPRDATRRTTAPGPRSRSRPRASKVKVVSTGSKCLNDHDDTPYAADIDWARGTADRGQLRRGHVLHVRPDHPRRSSRRTWLARWTCPRATRTSSPTTTGTPARPTSTARPRPACSSGAGRARFCPSRHGHASGRWRRSSSAPWAAARDRSRLLHRRRDQRPRGGHQRLPPRPGS